MMLPDGFGDYIAYADESGDDSLTRIDPAYPLYVLACCIFRKDTYVDSVVPAMQRLKFDWFGHPEVILHERDIRRGNDPFRFDARTNQRRRFLVDVGRIIEGADFTLVAAVVYKALLVQATDIVERPSIIALRLCLERVERFRREQGEAGAQAHVVLERRGVQEDRILGAAFEQIVAGDNAVGPMRGLKPVFQHKQSNSVGLQLADLAARPIGMHALRPEQANRAYATIEPKLRRSPSGQIDGWGLKMFPDANDSSGMGRPRP